MSDSAPLISIIMPVYNVELYVEDAIKSLLGQTYQNFEVIIVNDGSTDKTLPIVQSYTDSDSRIHVINQANKGPSSARNMGLQIVQGRYIYFFDGDDLLEPTAFEICIGYIDSMELDFVVFSGEVYSTISGAADKFQFYQKPDILVPLSGMDLLVRLYSVNKFSPSPCLYVFSKKYITDNNLFFDEGYLHEDEAFTVALYCLSQRTISLSNPFFKRRVRHKSIMMTPKSSENIQGWIQAVVKIDQFISDYSDLLKMDVEKVLRSIQYRLLRMSRNIAEEISVTDLFVCLVRKKLSVVQLIKIDFSTLFYTRLNRLFIRFRSYKRQILY